MKRPHAVVVATTLLLLAGPGGRAAGDHVGGPGTAAQAAARPRVHFLAGDGVSSAAAVPRGGWTWPLAGSPAVVEAFERPEHRWSPGHRGVDLAAEPATAVLAPTSGVVVTAGRVVDRGVLSIQGSDGLRATLEPVTPTVGAGEAVVAGAVVGEVAATTANHCAPRSCLHWGVRVGRDTYLDPLLVLVAGGRPQAPVLLPPPTLGDTSPSGRPR